MSDDNKTSSARRFSFDDDPKVKQDATKKAHSMGLSLSAYLRNLVRSDLYQSSKLK